MERKTKKIYIVLSQTGTSISRLLKLFTKAKYNHSSISLTEGLQRMYSFGRIYTWTFLFGGFVKESPNTGTFRRFKEAECCVIALDVTKEQYEEAWAYLDEMYKNKKQYSYNRRGVVMAGFHKTARKKNGFYCSEFVKDILLRFAIVDEQVLPEITTPNDFYKLFQDKIVYEGKVKDYPAFYQRKKDALAQVALSE